MFASLVPAGSAGSADFSLNLSAQSAMISPGGSANLMVSASAVGGFNSQISLSCSAPAGLSCTFSPSTISPGSSASSATLTISATSAPPSNGYKSTTLAALLPGLGIFGTLLVGRKRKPLKRKRTLWVTGLGLLLLVSLFALGCGGSSSNKPAISQINMTVTGTSGSLQHSSVVAVTIN